MNSVSDTSNPLKRVAVVGTCVDSGGLLNAGTPGRRDAKDIRESAAHSRVVQPVNSLSANFTNSAITPHTNLLQQVSVYQTVNSFTGR